jgi:Raf kinase inhibitor-like YbhB/YbcL family protein
MQSISIKPFDFDIGTSNNNSNNNNNNYENEDDDSIMLTNKKAARKNNRIVRTVCCSHHFTTVQKCCCLVIILPSLTGILCFIIMNVQSKTKKSLKIHNSSTSNASINNNPATTGFTIVSSAFNYGETIPSKYIGTISPPLQWYNVPNGTVSFVLLMNDPDAPDPANPQTVWIHWLLYDIPVSTLSLPENINFDNDIDNQQQNEYGRIARNDWERFQYDGPSPPIGKHRYYIKLYALNILFGDLGPDVEWEMLQDRVNQHLINVTEYMGTYQNPQRV